MAYKIDETQCIGCGTCAGNCPVACIAENGGVYKIDETQCIGCGTCAGNCPVACISEN